jgi:hypothetical protein
VRLLKSPRRDGEEEEHKKEREKTSKLPFGLGDRVN